MHRVRGAEGRWLYFAQRGHVLACAYVPSLGAPAPTDADLMLRRTWLIEYGWRLYGERTVQRQSKDA
jgi:hypothetical protein